MTKKVIRACHIITEGQFGQIIAWGSIGTAEPAAWCSAIAGGCSSNSKRFLVERDDLDKDPDPANQCFDNLRVADFVSDPTTTFRFSCLLVA